MKTRRRKRKKRRSRTSRRTGWRGGRGEAEEWKKNVDLSVGSDGGDEEEGYV